jgi:hypothetical protein
MFDMYLFENDHLLSYSVERRAALQRDNHQCRYCENPGHTTDHIVPLAKNGSHHRLNLVAACDPCNGHKNDRSLAEWRRILQTNPPASMRLLAKVIVQNIPGVQAQADRLALSQDIAVRTLILPKADKSLHSAPLP